MIIRKPYRKKKGFIWESHLFVTRSNLGTHGLLVCHSGFRPESIQQREALGDPLRSIGHECHQRTRYQQDGKDIAIRKQNNPVNPV